MRKAAKCDALQEDFSTQDVEVNVDDCVAALPDHNVLAQPVPDHSVDLYRRTDNPSVSRSQQQGKSCS